jgi:hypothetical protein
MHLASVTSVATAGGLCSWLNALLIGFYQLPSDEIPLEDFF